MPGIAKDHNLSVFDAFTRKLFERLKTIPDGVDLARFGYRGHPGTSQGAPVEGAVSPDRKFFYVTNYSMYGNNFGPEGSDDCGGPSGLSLSFVYRVSVKTLEITGVAQVGMVPKYIAVTPNNKYILVTNWCSFDLSVIDRRTQPKIREAVQGTMVTLEVTVDRHRPPPPRNSRAPYLVYASDDTGDVVLTADPAFAAASAQQVLTLNPATGELTAAPAGWRRW